MSFELSEIGRTGQTVDVLRGGDVNPNGRLLTYHEIREALRVQTATAAADHPAVLVRECAANGPSAPPSLPDNLRIAWDRINAVRAREFSLLDTETFRQFEDDHRVLQDAGVQPPARLAPAAPLKPDLPVGPGELPAAPARMRQDPDLLLLRKVGEPIPGTDQCLPCPVCAADV